MYAKNPEVPFCELHKHTTHCRCQRFPHMACEVLGGMLHLVFCLDLVHQWVQSRDDQIKAGVAPFQQGAFKAQRLQEMEQNLQKAQQSMVQCQAQATAENSEQRRTRRCLQVHQPYGPVEPGRKKLQGEPRCQSLKGSVPDLFSVSLVRFFPEYLRSHGLGPSMQSRKA